MLSGLLYVVERRGAGARPRALEARARLPAPDRARHGEPEPAAVGSAGARLVRAQPLDLPHPARGLPAQPGRADRAARGRRSRTQARPAALARRAHEGRDRRVAAPSAAGALPRRADDRARRDDAEADPRVRRPVPRAARRDGDADEPLHGGRRGPLRARRSSSTTAGSSSTGSSARSSQHVRRLEDDRGRAGERRAATSPRTGR